MIHDIEEYTNNFFKIEMENNFFFKKDSSNFYYWDILRHDMFYYLYKPHKINISEIKHSPKKSQLKKIFSFLLTIIKAFSNRKKYLFFLASRNQGKDIISNPYMTNLHSEDLFKIETVFNSENEKDNLFYTPNIYKKISKSENYEISRILANTYNVDSADLDSFIHDKISSYKSKYFFYKILFILASPKIIFMVQNGIQKAMFKAANDLGIPIVELQHGYIGYFHPAYSYPKKISNNLIEHYLPSYVFLFSDFWKKNIYYPTKFESVGQLSISDDSSIISSDDLLFISANVYHKYLINIAIETAIFFKNRTIIYKLHPNQVKDFDSIKLQCSNFSNIRILLSDWSISELINRNKNVILLQSTVAYEALQNKNMVYILKQADYKVHSDIFEYVDLFDTSDELIKLIQKNENAKSVKDTPTFFEPFNKDKFLKVIQEIESK